MLEDFHGVGHGNIQVKVKTQQTSPVINRWNDSWHSIRNVIHHWPVCLLDAISLYDLPRTCSVVISVGASTQSGLGCPLEWYIIQYNILYTVLLCRLFNLKRCKEPRDDFCWGRFPVVYLPFCPVCTGTLHLWVQVFLVFVKAKNWRKLLFLVLVTSRSVYIWFHSPYVTHGDALYLIRIRHLKWRVNEAAPQQQLSGWTQEQSLLLN